LKEEDNCEAEINGRNSLSKTPLSNSTNTPGGSKILNCLSPKLEKKKAASSILQRFQSIKEKNSAQIEDVKNLP